MAENRDYNQEISTPLRYIPENYICKYKTLKFVIMYSCIYTFPRVYITYIVTQFTWTWLRMMCHYGSVFEYILS